MRAMPQLLVSIVYHVALGVAVTALLWSAGLGWLRLARREATMLDPATAVYAYPAGLLACLVTAFALLVHALLGVAVGAVALGLPIAALVRTSGIASSAWRRAAGPLALSTPYLLAFCVAFGIK